MDGEVTQVVELEAKGVYYLIEGTKEMIALMARGISALSDWNYQKWLDAPGECSWQKIQEASEGAAPILEFPAEMFEPQITATGKNGPSIFEEYCEEHDLRYCILPDFDPSDDYIPVAVVDKDISIHQEYIKKAMNERIGIEEERDEAYDEEIRETEQVTEQPDISKEERKEAEEKLEELQQAKAENQALLEESKEKMERDNVLPFDEYLKAAEGTEYATDMPKALSSYNKIGGVVREYMPSDCMYPIRDQGKVPESKEIFYSQTTNDEKIYTVRRSFDTDNLGIVYSTYHVFREGNTGEEVIFSDKGISDSEWKTQLPVMLKEAGMQIDVPTAAIHTSERLARYIRSVEENFTQASEEKQGQQVTDSENKTVQNQQLPEERENAQALMESIIEEEEQKKAYASSRRETMEFPSDMLMFTDHQTVAMEAGDQMVDGLEVLAIDENHTKIFIDDEKSYPVLDAQGKKTGELIGSELRDLVDQMKDAKIPTAITTFPKVEHHGRS